MHSPVQKGVFFGVENSMESLAFFHFYQSLNDFLLLPQRNTWITYSFRGIPAVKDAIEAIGVPHTEVAVILVNSLPVNFSLPLHPGDRVEVFPAAENSSVHLPAAEEHPGKFVLDVHLGKLARLLRMLGIDTCYEINNTDKEIVQIAVAENRIVLTRDVGLLKHKAIKWGYWLRSQVAEEQLTEVVRRYQLAAKFRPFERCLACNGTIAGVSKELVKESIPPDTNRYFTEFFQCTSCKRVYWKGSHYERMERMVEQIQKQFGE